MTGYANINGERRTLQFSLRHMLVAMVILSCGLALVVQGYPGEAVLLACLPLMILFCFLGSVGLALVIDSLLSGSEPPNRLLRISSKALLLALGMSSIAYVLTVSSSPVSAHRSSCCRLP